MAEVSAFETVTIESSQIKLNVIPDSRFFQRTPGLYAPYPSRSESYQPADRRLLWHNLPSTPLLSMEVP